MPLPSSACHIPEDVCCTTLYDISNFILEHVHAAVSSCLPLDCDDKPMKLLKYVTMGQGDDGVADSLTVAFQGSTLSPKSVDLNGRQTQASLVRGDFDVRLRESGWPIVRTDGGKLDAPDPKLQHAIARHAYSHGERMYRVLRAMANIRRPDEWIEGYPVPSFITVGGLRTINPLGGIVGFSAILTLDLPWGIGGH